MQINRSQYNTIRKKDKTITVPDIEKKISKMICMCMC